jgi:putative RNA 2'-phosphotransferase
MAVSLSLGVKKLTNNESVAIVLNEKQKQMSKFFTKILRHAPEEFGIKLNDDHYCTLEDFCQVVQKKFHAPTSKEEISLVLLNSMWHSYHRFEISEGYVRATYRHTYYQE